MQARRDWQDKFKIMKNRDLQSRLPYPENLSFRIEGQIKSFPDKKKLKEFIITKPLLYECYRDLFKKKKINAMNNKMAINTYLPSIESEKQTKQTGRTETESWIQKAY